MPIPRSLNGNFFKTYSSSMAYVLGFFAANGNMIKNRRGGRFIAFYTKDRDLIVRVRRSLGSDHAIGEKGPLQSCYQLQIGSKEMFNDLISLGMCPKKSST